MWLAWQLGLQAQEMASLTWEQVDLEGNRLCRVEMIITGLDVESEMPDSLTKYKTMYNTSTTSSD